MAPEDYDVAFVGGGLAATLLLNELRPASLGRVVVVDPWPLAERPPIHLSYWSRGPTLYDRFAAGVWRRARVADGPPEPLAPFCLRLVRSTDALAGMAGVWEGPNVDRLRATARSISRLGDGSYEVITDSGDVRVRYLRTKHPEAEFAVANSEYGVIPLGFALPRTSGPRHVLIGAKRGLVKPSAGYGVVRIARESERLSRMWGQHRRLPPTRRLSFLWGLLDSGFVRLAAQDPRLPLALLGRVMRDVPLAQFLGFIDERISPGQLGPLLRSAAPVVLRKG